MHYDSDCLSDVGATGPQAIEAEFDIDLSQTTRIPQLSPPYHRLSRNAFDDFKSELERDTQVMSLARY